jgi:hypothetical protein
VICSFGTQDFGFSAQVLPMLATSLLRVVSAPWRLQGQTEA